MQSKITDGLKSAITFILSSGNCHDAPQGRILLETVGKQKQVKYLVMDRGYEDDYTRYIAQTLGFFPIVPPKSNRKNPWEYDKELYKMRNEIERLFRLLKASVVCFVGLINWMMFTSALSRLL